MRPLKTLQKLYDEESQVVITGLEEGQLVALTSPEQNIGRKGAPASKPGMTQAIPK